MTITIDNALINFKRPSDHSTYSPSSTDRWMACPFSIEYCKNIPQETSKYAEEGTIAHSVVEAVFGQEFFGLDIPNDLQMKLTQLEDGGHEMMDGAQSYVSCIKGWLNNEQDIGKVIHYGLEKGIPIFPEDGCFGTADCIIIGDKGCAVIDYKYGKGKNVSANSLQLRTYLAGVLRHLRGTGKEYKLFSIIVQPRTDIVPKVAEYNLYDIEVHTKQIAEAIQMSKQKGLYPVEGKHCFWCPASRIKDSTLKCPALKQKAIDLANEEFGKFLSDMNAPVEKFGEQNVKRDEAIIKIMSILPLLEKVAKDGEEEFALRISKGESIPGIQVVEKQGNRKWIHEDMDEMAKEIKKHFPNVEPTKTITSIKTITEIEKKIGKNKADVLTYRPLNKKITVMDEKSQAILGELSKFALTLEE